MFLNPVFVVAMIALSSALAAYEAIDRLIHPRQVTHLWAVAAAAIVGFAGNEIVARHRIRIGRRIGSAALAADGLHARTDAHEVAHHAEAHLLADIRRLTAATVHTRPAGAHF